MTSWISRRGMLGLGAMGAFALPRAGSQQSPVEYFEDTKWFERPPGNVQPRIHEGNLVLDRREEKLAYFAGYTMRLEIPLKRIKSLTYEFAKRPSDPTFSEGDWTKAFNRSRRHFLVMEYQDKEGYFKLELLELTKKQWNEVIVALEYATGLQVKRL